ncbi:hypothetical protein K8R04_02290 [Candidatus Uhrbacteria bacterium]|nr:hypothetical protein [Candidatus Uhrbacteria bacterium]
MAVEQTVTATSSILLGVAAPKADRDQAYLLALPGKTIEQQEMGKGWRLGMWSLESAGDLRMVPASPDGKAPILTDGAEWNVSMRSPNGEPYIEPRIVGLADETHVFVIATTDARKLLLVSRSGEIRSIYDLPEYVNALSSTDGHAWFSTFVPGEGIESEPMGPSRLIRVSVSGIQESLAEETRFIVSVTPGPDGALAYRTDDGDVVVTAMDKRWSGNGIPLLWLDQNRILLSQGRSVFVLDMRALSLELLQQLPAAPSAAHML